MSFYLWKRVLSSTVLAVGVAVLIDACSSGSSTTATSDDGGGDAGTHLPPVHKDASGVGTPEAGVDASTAAPFDGTTGKACTSNADCKGSAADAPGTNVCSNNFTFTVSGVKVQLWPTPVCILPLTPNSGNCDPGDGTTIQFCDSADPNDPTSPGICLPNTSPPTPGLGNGDCLPSCTFGLDGSAPSGCPGHDTCVYYTFSVDQSGAVSGFGFCQGTCQTDADCSAMGTGWSCETDIGFCTQTKKTRTKAVGTGCTNTSAATSDSTAGRCFCPFSGSSFTSFYCTQSCVVGGTACPTGYACETFEPSQLTFTGAAADGGDIVLAGPKTQNTGLSGICMVACSGLDGGTDGGGDGGASQCPSNSACTEGTVAGPDCQPM